MIDFINKNFEEQSLNEDQIFKLYKEFSIARGY